MLDEYNLLEKKKRKFRLKKKAIALVVMLFLMVSVGITYAFFSFSRTSTEDQTLVAGNIYLVADTKNFTVGNNLKPMTSSEGMTNGAKYNFTVKGVNTSSKDVSYGIYINQGEAQSGKKRIDDSDIMMVLKEKVGNETRVVYGPGSLDEFDDTLIYANTVDSGTNSEVTRDYELTAWISEKVLISDSETNLEGRSIYTTGEYANSYATLNVTVEGDFTEREATDGNVTLTTKTKTNNVTYLSNLSYDNTPFVNDNVVTTFTITKEPNKLIIINELTNAKTQVTPTKSGNNWVYQKEDSVSGKFTYYVEYKDGKESDRYHYNVRIDKDNPSFNMGVGGSVKIPEGSKTIMITNTITSVNDTNINSIKYAMVTQGSTPTTYKEVYRSDNGYVVKEELPSGLYELYVKVTDDAGKETTQHVSYVISRDIAIVTVDGVKRGIVLENTRHEVVDGQTYNYIESLSGETVDRYTFTSFSLDKEGLTTVTNASTVLASTDRIYANYELSVIPISATITSCTSREYNGNNNATCVLSLSGVREGDDVTVNGTCTFNNAAVANGKTATCTGLTLNGEEAYDYELSATTINLNNAANITPKTLTPSITSCSNKTYNGNTTADCTAPDLTGQIGSEVATLTKTCNFDNKNVGTSKTVTCALSITGTNASNYQLSTSSINKTANITAKSLTPTVTASNKTYDGNTTATCSVSLSGIVGTENVTATATGAFNNKNAGTDKAVTCSSIALAGNDKGNYVLSTNSGSTTANITAKAITITAKPQTITYGGSIATGTGQVTVATLASGDSLTAITLTPSTDQYTTNGKITPSAATIKDSNGSGTAVTSNYTITYADGTLTINKKQLTPSINSCSNKEYDGGTTASCTFTLTTPETGDTVSVTGTCNFANATVANGKTVSCTGLTLSGADAGNYSLSTTEVSKTSAANITQKTLTPSITSCNNKTYDGGNSATCTAAALSGIVGSETVTLNKTCTFNNKNVGTGKAVTCSLSLSGTNAGNYKLSTNSISKTANITAKAITITAKAQTISYGGSITTGVNQVTVATLVDGDTLTAITLTPSTNQPTTTGKITPSAATIKDGSNADMTSNYSITYNTGTLTINNKSITATLSSCSNKTYDGGVTATCSLSPSGVETGDTVTVTGTCTFNNKNVGTSKAVTCNSLTLGGADAGKYTLSTTSLSGTANITAKAITITAKPQTITYGGAIATGTGQVTVATLASGDSLTAITLTPSTDQYTTNGKITPSAATIKDSNGSGTAVTSNYTITYADGTLTINKKQLTPSITSCSNKEYDGTASASCTFSLATPETGDTVSVSGTCTFNNAAVANGKTVSCTGLTLSGADATNYSLSTTEVSKTSAANITKKTLTPSITSCNNKTYDGGNSATCTAAALTGIVGSETVSLTKTCTFNNKNVGTGKAVTCSLGLSGTNAGNYQLSTNSISKTANITAKAITITAKAQTINYGGSITTGVNQVTVATLVDGDTLTAITLTPSTDQPTTTGKITPSAATIKDASDATMTSNYTITYADGTLTINNKSITATLSSCSNKTYDGGVTATCTLSPSGVQSGDTVTVTGTCTFNNKNVGTSKAVTCNSLTLGGADAGKYTLSTTSLNGTANITAKAITITAKPQTITYGGAIATGTGQVTVATLASGDSLTAITLAASTNQPTTTGTITPSAATIKDSSGSGNDVTSNYTITYKTGTLTINNKSITATLSSCSNKTYDGGVTATCTLSPSGVVSGDTVTVSGTCTFANKNVGTGKAVTCNSLTLGGANAGKYTLSTTSLSGTANITAKALTGTVTASDKVFDGGTTATCGSTVTLSGVVSGDTVTATANTTGAFDNKNVGTGKTVTCSGIALAGADAGNYSIASSATTTAAITIYTPTLTVSKTSASVAANSTGNFTATPTTISACLGDLTATSASASLVTVATSSTGTYAVSATHASAASGSAKTFYYKGVGYTTGNNVVVSYVPADTTNCASATTKTVAISVSRVTPTVTLTAKSEANREYTGSAITANTATATAGGSAVTLSYTYKYYTNSTCTAGETTTAPTAVGTYYAKAISTQTSVYASASSDCVNHSIVGKTLTPSITSCSNKTYDGGTSATCTAAALSGIVGSETVSLSKTCTFNNKNVGTGKAVTCSLSLSGTNAGNYRLSTNSISKTANITAKAITITAKPQTITYGGSIATGTGQVTVATLVSGDSLTAITLTPSTDQPTTTGTITPSAATIKDGSNADMTSNYSITYNTGTLTINNKSITATLSSCSNKTYDGGVTATCSLSPSGVETGDTVTVSGTCTFNNKNVGTGKAVTCNSLTLGGANAGKYTLSTTSLSGTANITAKAITITAKPQTITYGSSIATGTGQVTVATLVSGDSLTAITLAASTNQPTTTGTITPSAATIKDSSGSGNDVTSNYTITYKTGTLTINNKSITATLSSCSNKTYDGGVTATCSLSPSGVVSGDTVTVSGTCTFANKNVGTSKAVTCNSLTLGGANAGKYTLSTTSLSGTANITKYTPSLAVSKESASVAVNSTGNFTATPTTISACLGDLVATSTSASYVKVANASNGTYAVSATHADAPSGTAKTFYYQGIGYTTGNNVTVSYVPDDTDNCNSATTKTVAISVTRIANSITVNCASLTYNGSAQQLISSVTVSGGTPYYKVGTQLTSSNYSTTGSSDKTTVTGTNATSYTIYYYVPATSVYSELSGSKTCSIAQNPTCQMSVGTPATKHPGETYNLSSLVSGAQGTVTYALKSGGNNTTTASTLSGSTLTLGAMSTANDTNQSVDVQITDAGSTNYAGCTVDKTITVEKYTRTLSWSSGTPAANATLTYGNSYTATVTASGSGGTAGSITYASNNESGATINSTTGAITVVNGNSKAVTITASMARTATVKAASTTRAFTTGKHANTITLTCATLTYNGSAQNLLSNKTATGGSVYIATTSLTASNYSTSGSTNLSGAQGTDAGSYTVYAYTPGNDNYAATSTSKSCSIAQAACTLSTTAKTVTTGGTVTLSTAASGASGSLTYALKSGGRNTTTASTISNGVLTAGAMSSANDNDQPVDVQITDAGDTNHEGCTKDVVITVQKITNNTAAKAGTVYVSSTTALSTFVQNNNGGSLSATITTDNEGGTQGSISGTNFVAGTLAANDDANKTVVLSITSARTTTVAQKTVSSTVTVQKYTNNLSWSSGTPAANATLTYGNSYTATATAATNGGTNGAITYASNNESGATINSTTGAITVVNGNSKAVTITASMAGTTTVKAASTTRSFTTGKHSNTITLTCATLTYTGSAQNLLSAKTATGGSVYIATTSLTASNYSTSGSTNLSGAQGTNAGSYTVYAYTPGNDNYAAASTSKSCSIAQNPTCQMSVGTPATKHPGETYNLSSLVSGAQGTVTYALKSGGSNTTTASTLSGSTLTIGAMSTANDNNQSIDVQITDAGSTNYAGCTVDKTITAEKYTRTLSWSSGTPAANATLTYGNSYTATVTASGSGGTAGSITYASNNESGATINSTTGAITVVNGNSKAVTITASMARTATVKTASTTRAFTTGKHANTITLTCATLTYTGSAQNLLSNKTATGGSVYIAKTSLTSSNYSTSGSTNLSGAQGTDAGSYTVYAYTPGNDNYAAASTSKSCSIAQNPTCQMSVGTPATKHPGETYNLSSLVSGAQGTVTYALKSGGSNTTTASTISGSTLTIGAMSTANDNNQSIDVQITDAGSTNYAGCTVDKTITAEKYTRTLSWSSGTPAANATLTYGNSYTATVTASGSGGTAGSITYASNNESGATINSTSGAITVVNGNSKAVTITASMARTATVKAASTTRAFTTGKHSNTITLTCATLTYTGSAQNLLSNKTATGGSVYIATTSLTASNYSTSGSTNLNGAQGTDAGSYTVYAYTPGNDNYAAASTSKSCSIAQNPTCQMSVGTPATKHPGETYNLSSLVSGAQGTVTYALKSGGSNTTTASTLSGSTLTIGAMSTANDNNQSIDVQITDAGSTNYAGCTVDKTITAEKYTRTLSWSSGTPAASSTLTYGNSYTATATASGSGGTAGSITYASNNESGATINSTSGAITVVNGNSKAVTITATLARTSTVKQATTTRAFTTGKHSNTITLTCATLTYNGSAQNLLSNKTATGGSVYIATTSLTASNYSTSGSTNLSGAQGTNAGSYTVYAYTPGNDNYAATSTSKSCSISQLKCNTPTSLAVSTAGYVTWTASSNCSSATHQVKVASGSYANATSPVDKNTDITNITGNSATRTVYVKAVAPDTNYLDSDEVYIDVSVIKITFASNDTNKGTVSPTSKYVISGATVTTSSNNLLIKGVTTGTTTTTLATITPTANTGYHFSSWSKTSGSLTSAQTITATFAATSYTIGLNGNGGGIPATTGWTIGTNGDGYQYATKSIDYNSTYGTLPTPERDGYTFNGWYSTLSLGNITFEASSNNYNFQILEYALQPGVTYKVTMDSATITSGSATQFDIYAYDFTSDSIVAYALGTYGGSNLSYNLAVPSSADASHMLRIIIYAGRSGSTAGNAVTYSNVKIGTMGNTTETQITSSTTMSTAYDHQLVAKWTLNKVTLTLQKGTSNTACTTCNGYVVHISTSSTNDTATFTGTTTTASTLVINGAMSPSTNYYVWVAKDSNHKTAGTSNANMAYSGVSFTGAAAATGTIHFYTVTMSLSNSTMTFNGTSVANNGTVVALGTGTSSKIHAIVATPSTDYAFDNWTSSTTSSAIASTTNASTTMNVGADTTLSTTTHLNVRTVTYNYSTNGGTSATASTAQVLPGSAVDLTPTATKSGWDFVGWNTDSTATTGLSSLTMGSSDTILYAIFRKLVTVTFDKNGATSQTPSGGTASTAASINVSCYMYNTDTSCSITSPTIARDGFEIIGYGTATGSSSSSWAVNTASAASANTTYYAVTRKTVTYTFYLNGNASQTNASGTAVADDYVTRNCVIQNTNTSCSITSPTIGAPSGFTVKGYTTGQTVYSSHWAHNSSKSGLTADAVWFAQTEKASIRRTATFIAQGATISDSSKYCDIPTAHNGATQATTCTITMPTIQRTGYSICGWSTSNIGNSSIVGAGSTLTLSSSPTYYAITGMKEANLRALASNSGAGLWNVTSANLTSTTEGANGAKYMYRGANPNNYIKFNCTDEASHTCSTASTDNWRILSIEHPTTSATGYVIEIVNVGSTTTSVYHSATGKYWSESNIRTNAIAYYNNIAEQSRSHVVTASFYYKTLTNNYLGQFANNGNSLGLQNASTSQIAITEIQTLRNETVGIPRLSDYMATSLDVSSTTKAGANGSTNAAGNNWLKVGADTYFISRRASGTAIYQTSTGAIYYDSQNGTQSKRLLPVVHLDSNIFLIGSGTSSDPYYICPNCISSNTCTVTSNAVNGGGTSLTLTINPSTSAVTYSWNGSSYSNTKTTTATTTGVYTGYIKDNSTGLVSTCGLTIVTKYQHNTCSKANSCDHCPNGYIENNLGWCLGDPLAVNYTNCNIEGYVWYNNVCYRSYVSKIPNDENVYFCGCKTWDTSDTTWYTESCFSSDYRPCKNRATGIGPA